MTELFLFALLLLSIMLVAWFVGTHMKPPVSCFVFATITVLPLLAHSEFGYTIRDITVVSSIASVILTPLAFILIIRHRRTSGIATIAMSFTGDPPQPGDCVLLVNNQRKIVVEVLPSGFLKYRDPTPAERIKKLIGK